MIEDDMCRAGEWSSNTKTSNNTTNHSDKSCDERLQPFGCVWVATTMETRLKDLEADE
jgi:hypothetical protein